MCSATFDTVSVNGGLSTCSAWENCGTFRTGEKGSKKTFARGTGSGSWVLRSASVRRKISKNYARPLSSV